MVRMERLMSTSPISEGLTGSKILVTGVTGFVGQAVLERLLADVPDVGLVLLVRSQGGLSGRDRVESLLAGPAFNTLRERIGAPALRGMLGDRVEVIEADFSEGTPALPAHLDVAFLCAASVSF